MTRVMSVRLSDEQYAELRAIAEAGGSEVSAELRRRGFPPTSGLKNVWRSPWMATLIDGSQVVLDGDDHGCKP